MSLYVSTTTKEPPKYVREFQIRLKDGKTITVTAILHKVTHVYAMYWLNIDRVTDRTTKKEVYSLAGKKTSFVRHVEEDCTPTELTDDNGAKIILATVVKVPVDSNACSIPRNAVISIETDNNTRYEVCGKMEKIEGYEVEYLVCLPKGISIDDVEYALPT